MTKTNLKFLAITTFILFSVLPTFAQKPVDTLIVQTFTFNDIEKRRDIFEFPETDQSWRKIIMVRTLKCDEQTTRDIYPCGEWDYITRTNVYIHKKDTTEEFELDNFITPYGKRLDLNGDKGWTWYYDVSDYAPLLKGKVDISSGNTQELLDMKFYFIPGIPDRKVISIENIYPAGSYKYKNLSDNDVLKPVKIVLNPEAKGYKIRARISGHGHFGPRNCCEWESKTHSYYLGDEMIFRWNVWKDCGLNSIFPQGGTWQFDRAGWCPGTPVDTYDFELTDKIKPGDTINLDYGIEAYSGNGEKGGNFQMSHQLISYGTPNFLNNAAIYDIHAPSSKDEYSRINPVCKEPRIIIQNTGRNILESLKIEYGLSNGGKSVYEWRGELKFLEKEEVILPLMNWNGLKNDRIFMAGIISVNGIDDENPDDNKLASIVKLPLVLPEKFIINIEANGLGRAYENGYTISDINGQVLYERDAFEDNAVYQDIIELSEGCYELTISDKKEDGMIRQWWFRGSQPELIGRNGRIALMDKDLNLIKELKYDFADELSLQFRVGEIK